jgi:hypothetical protein
MTAQSWAESDHRGQAEHLQARLGPSDSESAFVLEFAEKIPLQARSVDADTNKQEEGL